jgi:hypothetical protein
LDAYTVPSGGCTKMGLTQIEDGVGFFYDTQVAGKTVAVVVQCDIVELAKKVGSGEAVAQGAKIYYEAAGAALTGVAGANVLCGRAYKAALASDPTIWVIFNGDVAA